MQLNKILSDWSEVIFVEYPYSVFVHTFIKFKSRFPKIFKSRPYKNNNDITLFMPVMLFHHKFWKKIKMTLKIDNYLVAKQISSLLKKKYRDKKIIIWYYDPYNYELKKIIKPAYIVYDYYDNYEYEIDGKLNIDKRKFNQAVLKESDLIFCTGKVMFDNSVNLNSNTFYLPNGHDFKIVSENEKNELDLRKNINKKEIIIGYLGNIRDWIDFSLIQNLLNNLKSKQKVMFVGPVEKNVVKIINELKKNEKFIHIDKVSYEIAGEYIKTFDTGIIPFKINKFTEGVLPNKLFEYLAFGINIVSTSLPDVKYYSKFVNIADTNEKFIEYCINFDNYKKTYSYDEYENVMNNSTWQIKAEIINEKLKMILN